MDANLEKSALFLVCGADLVTQRKDISSAVRLFLFEKVLRVLEIEEGERVSGAASLLKVYLEDFLECLNHRLA